MILELNASDDRGINVIRDKIRNFAKIKSHVMSDTPKLIILDEADSLTNDAQFALRRTIERYTQNVRFCMICNYINKLISALQSRCMQFRFIGINKKTIKFKLNEIIKKEEIKITDDNLDLIIDLSEYDFRKNLNCLETQSFINKEITQERIYKYF